MFSAAFDVLIKISESYRPQIPTEIRKVERIEYDRINKKYIYIYEVKGDQVPFLRAPFKYDDFLFQRRRMPPFKG